MIRYLNEFIGTFFLVLTIGMSALEPNSVGSLAPLAIGAVLLSLIFAGGHISGGHYNPAVTLAVFFRGNPPFAVKDLIAYWIAQIVGGILAGLLTIYFKGTAPQNFFDISILRALIAEFLFTFALCYVVLNVAFSKQTSGNSFYGLAIGFIVVAGAYAVGAISSAAFNPAVAFGLIFMKFLGWKNLWIFIVANLLGGLVAAYAYKLTHPKEAQ